MSDQGRITLHEALEVNELVRTSVIGAKKLKASMGMVKDNNLKSIMHNSFDAKQRHIEELQNFIQNSGVIQ